MNNPLSIEKMKEKLKGRISPLKGLTWEERYGIEKAEEIRKKLKNSLKTLKGENNSFYGKHHSEKWKRERSKLIKGRHLHLSEKRKEENRIFSGRLWQNPEFVKKVLLSRNIKPNKDEKLLDNIIQKIVPNEFIYNGDFSQDIMIGGKIPDWFNVNGKKNVIEYFGDYWHNPLLNPKINSRRTSDATIEHYKKFGYDCLIIWRHELKDLDKVIEKISQFCSE